MVKNKYVWLILVAALVASAVGLIKIGNTVFMDSTDEYKQQKEREIFAKVGITPKTFGSDTSASKAEQSAVIDLVNYVEEQLPGQNSETMMTKNAIYSYIEYRLKAINASSQVEVKNNYDIAYASMSCFGYFLKSQGKNNDVIFDSINQRLRQDKDILEKQDAAEKKLSGSMFVDIDKLDKEEVCKNKFKGEGNE